MMILMCNVYINDCLYLRGTHREYFIPVLRERYYYAGLGTFPLYSTLVLLYEPAHVLKRHLVKLITLLWEPRHLIHPRQGYNRRCVNNAIPYACHFVGVNRPSFAAPQGHCQCLVGCGLWAMGYGLWGWQA